MGLLDQIRGVSSFAKYYCHSVLAISTDHRVDAGFMLIKHNPPMVASVTSSYLLIKTGRPYKSRFVVYLVLQNHLDPRKYNL